MQETFRKVADVFKKKDYFTITSHQNIDGDGIGSALAVYFLLKGLNKKARVIYDAPVPYFYEFLPGVSFIEKFAGSDFKKEVLVVVDCSNLKRTGQIAETAGNYQIIVNIDHHPDNQYFGNVNLVDPEAPSCSLLLYKLIKENNFVLTREIATSILTGIITDTGNFQFVEMNTYLLEVLSELTQQGASLSQIIKHAFRYRKLEALRLLGRALSKMEYDAERGIASIYVTQEDFKTTSAHEDDTEGIVDYGLFIPGSRISVLFKETQPSYFKVSLRSQDDLNLLPIVHHFGGGGHEKAAGFKITGNFETVKIQVLQFIRNYIDQELLTKKSAL
jgi:phosphoesterase RecJ-like protein